MTDDIVKRLRGGTGDGLRAYDWMNEAADRIEKLEKALRVAAGYISTFPPHTDQHPQDVYDWILMKLETE